jgi:uncharacterized protein YdbL (DUF1318 family)
MVVFAAIAFAQSESELKQRVQARAQAVSALHKSGIVREGANGLLAATTTLDAPQAQTVQEENKDRQAIFALIAKKSKLTSDEVAAMYARRAQKLIAEPGPFTGGPCNLTPAKDVDIARLLQYMKQGMIYATMNKPEPALSEFQQALAIDKNFLGLNQNVASALIALKRYTEAESSLKNEIKLIGCLDPLPDTTLSRFAYMMEIQEKDLAKRSLRQAEVLRTQLGKVKALSQYNLACLYSLQKQKRPALDALRDAVKAGFDDQKALNSDPDLSFIRSSPEFKEILSTADKGKR